MILVKYQTIMYYYNIVDRYLPDKMQMIGIAFYIWAWILFQISSFFTFILKSIIMNAPDYLIPNFNTNKTNINIIKAIDKNNNDITKKIKLYMNFMWNKSDDEEGGSVDLDKFTEYIKSSCIWVLYFFDSDFSDIDNIDNIASNKLHNRNIQRNIDNISNYIKIIKSGFRKSRNDPILSDEESDILLGNVIDNTIENTRGIYTELKYFINYARLIIVNTREKYVVKINNDSDDVQIDDILFGEVEF